VGSAIGAGDVIARSGTTGLLTGCHLNFIILQDCAPVDPMARR
jgi:murein DD-endopeptidase MepM/ murein hydrolase activator NlpD